MSFVAARRPTRNVAVSIDVVQKSFGTDKANCDLLDSGTRMVLIPAASPCADTSKLLGITASIDAIKKSCMENKAHRSIRCCAGKTSIGECAVARERLLLWVVR